MKNGQPYKSISGAPKERKTIEMDSPTIVILGLFEMSMMSSLSADLTAHLSRSIGV